MSKDSSKSGNDAKQLTQPEDQQHNLEEKRKPIDAEEGKERNLAFDDKRLREHAARKAHQSSRNHDGYKGL